MAADLSEFGSSGLRKSGGFVTEEFLPSLRGARGSKVYREMADNDPVVGSVLYAIEKIITRLEWRIDAFDDSDVAEANKEFVQTCIDDMSDSWDSTVASILSMLIFGYSYHEIVYKIRGGESKDPKRKSRFDDGKIGWRKFAGRAQETLYSWQFDEDGGIQAMQQMDSSASQGVVIIPIDKSLLFRTTTAKNNPEGRSLLRNAYRPWFFKRRIEEIEAIGIERDLAGLPIAYVPPEYLSSNATAEQQAVVASLEQIVQNVKRNEQEGIVFPLVYDDNNNKMFDLQLLSTGGSRQFDTDKVIGRYDQRIAMSVLSDFILLGHEAVGSFALGSSKMDLWTMAVDSIAKSIAETINQHAIPRLLRLNGMDTKAMPYITYGDIAHVDLTQMADFASKLTAAGVIVSDPTLEDYLRELAGLPPAERETKVL